MRTTIDDYRYKGRTYGFTVDYSILEGHSEQGDYDHPTYHSPDQLANVELTNVQVYNKWTDRWEPVDDMETIMEIESNLTLDDLDE